jgi:hypothetical protein
MPLRFLLDEDACSHAIRKAINQHNVGGTDVLDVTWVGASADLPTGSDDRELLNWAAQHGRIVISKDRSTLPHALRDLLDEGGHCPGILFIRLGTRIQKLIESLVLIAYAGVEKDYSDQCGFIPLT